MCACLSLSRFLCLCVCMCLSPSVRACVCVCALHRRPTRMREASPLLGWDSSSVQQQQYNSTTPPAAGPGKRESTDVRRPDTVVASPRIVALDLMRGLTVAFMVDSSDALCLCVSGSVAVLCLSLSVHVFCVFAGMEPHMCGMCVCVCVCV